MSKVIKQMQMDALKQTFKDVRDLVLLNVVGLDAITENQMRLGLRKKGIQLQMVKNSLARRVFNDLGLEIKTDWVGSTTVAWGGSSIAGLSQELETLLRKHAKLMKAKMAVVDGQEVAFDVALKMPTREQALGQIVALALAPGARLAAALLGPGGMLASQLKAIEDKKEEGEKKEEGAAAPAAS
jgi:large subunit ribosomal protein L10